MAETIKEFLVSVGYKVEENSERKFKESIRSATLQADLLAQSLIGAAKATAEAVQKVAQNFDSLYWTAQRTATPVKSLQALSYAVSQLGGSYKGALSTIETFGQKLRSNPGFASLVRTLGVSTEQNGKLRDQVSILQDLGKVLSKQSYPVALQYANALGIDENTLRALMSGELARNMAEFQRIQKEAGLDPEKAAKASQELNREIRQTQATVSAFVSKMLVDFMPVIRQFLEEFRTWIMDHGPQIKEVIEKFGQAFLGVVKAVQSLVEGLAPLAKQFDDISQSLTGQNGLQTAFEAFAIYLTASWLTRVLGVFDKVKLGWIGVAAIALALDSYFAPKDAADFNDRMKNQPVSKAFDGTWIGGKVNSFLKWGRGVLGVGGGNADNAPASAPPTREDRVQNAKDAYQMFRDAGYSHAQALAWVGNLLGESQLNPAARGDGGSAHGVAQWHADRRAQILAGTGIDVSSASFKDQVKAIIWEAESSPDPANRVADRVKAQKTISRAVGEIVYGYERPADKEGDTFRRTGLAKGLQGIIPDNAQPSLAVPLIHPGQSLTNNKNVTLQQTTNIQVVGGSDPMATASAVQNAQGGVNSRLLRNTQGAVR